MPIPRPIVEQIRVRRSLMRRRPRKRRRLPSGQVGRGIEVAYAGRIKRVIADLRSALSPLFVELPDLLLQAKRERDRLDVGEGRRVRELVAQSMTRLGGTHTLADIELLAESFAERTSRQQRRQLAAQVRSAVGVDVLTDDAVLRQLTDGFVAENVALIQDVPRKIASDLERTIQRALTGGKLRRDIAKDLQRQFAMGRRRAELIARDQIGKFHGQLAIARQREMGVDRYVWRTVMDRRVRKLHQAREGEIFTHDEPPEDGHPGEPINCRCWAEPVLDTLTEAVV